MHRFASSSTRTGGRWPDDPVQRAFIVTWDNLPKILTLGLPAALGLLLLQAGHGGALLAVPVVAVLVLPTCTLLAARYVAAIDGDAFAASSGPWLRRTLTNIAISAPAHVVALLTQAATLIWASSRELALMLPVGVGTAGTAVAYTLATLAAAQPAPQGGPHVGIREHARDSWSAALHLSLHRPLAPLALIAAAVISCFAVVHLSFVGCIAAPLLLAIVLALSIRGRTPDQQDQHP